MSKVGAKGNTHSFRHTGAWLPKFLLLWILLMALIGWCIYSNMDADTKVRRKELLGSLCDQSGRMLQDQFSETFAEYTARTALERPLLSGVAYAQRGVNSERERFEKQHGRAIKTMERESSQVRDEYAPVIFVQETLSYLESIDMMPGEVNNKKCKCSRVLHGSDT